MAINRLKIAQPEGQDPKIVAFTDDILLNGLTGNGLITVSGNGKEKTVSTDPNKLTLDNDNNVKVATPLVIDNKTTPSTTTNKLYSVEGALYWNGQLVDSHEPGTGYVTQSEFDSTIGDWTTISDKTVKEAIEGNKAEIDTETTRATGVEDAIKRDIGSWSSGSSYENSTVKEAIENISAITGFEIIDHRPTDSDIGKKNTIYLFKPEGKNSYEEWIYIEESGGTKKWEKIGDTDIKLTDYYTKLEIGEGFSTGNTVKDYVDDETTRATGVEGGLDTRLTAAEGKLNGITGTVKAYVDAEKTRATGVEGTLNSLSTDAKGNLVAAINEVDSHADAAQTTANTAKTTAEARLASITGSNGGGVTVSFTTDSTDKTVTTAVSVAESTLGTDSRFNASDKNVATGAKVQAAIDAAEQRAKDAQTYTADGTTLQLSTNNQFSAKTAAVTQSSTALTTGGQVYTAIDTAKTALTGSGTVSGSDITIKGAMREAEAAQTAIGTLSSLKTAVKTDLVAAINEVNTNANAAQSTANTAQSTATTNSTAIGVLNTLTTDAKTNLVDAINEVDANANAAQTTANNAVQTAAGDANINASKSGSNLTVGVKTGSKLADLLSYLSISSE